MKSTTLLFAALLAAGVAGTSHAAEAGSWYLGTGIGAVQTKINLDDDEGFQEDKNGTAFKIFGGYQFNENWALELQYANLGTYKRTYDFGSLNVKTQAVSLSGVGMLPLTTDFSLLGKAGVAMQKGKLSVDGSNEVGTETKSALLLGVGAEYSLTKNVSIRGEYEYIGSNDIKNNLLTVGLRYAF